MQLKKEMKGAEPDLTNNNYKLEMNELVESDPEDYQPDIEDRHPRHGGLAEFLSEDLFSARSDSLQNSGDRLE